MSQASKKCCLLSFILLKYTEIILTNNFISLVSELDMPENKEPNSSPFIANESVELSPQVNNTKNLAEMNYLFSCSWDAQICQSALGAQIPFISTHNGFQILVWTEL